MITIRISTDNASFKDEFSKAVNYALLQVQNAANEVEVTSISFPSKYSIFDVNGNRIGYAKFTK
jgi:hypothetical protein